MLVPEGGPVGRCAAGILCADHVVGREASVSRRWAPSRLLVAVAVTLPLVGQFGLGLKLFDRLKIAADVTYVDWSAFRELRIEFEKNSDLTVPLPTPGDETGLR